MTGSSAVEEVLRSLRWTGDEAQVTQAIAAFAGGDRRFASDLAKALVGVSPHGEHLGPVPDELICGAESHLFDAKYQDLGYVDLRFESPDADFTLFVELKLHAGYGDRQLERYIDALEALPSGNSGLLAVTSHLPRYGEDEVIDNPKWLGSVRWSEVYDALTRLKHDDKVTAPLWPALLKIIREQGDFGLMNIDPANIRGWSRWKQGRSTLIALLESIHEPALELVQRKLADAQGIEPNDELASYVRFKGSRLVWPWGDSINLQIAVPASNDTERIRIQVAGGRDIPVFTTEARHEDARPLLREREPALMKATKRLRQRGFDEPGYDYGSYWSRPHPPEEWLDKGDQIQEALMELIEQDLDALIESGILEGLPAAEPGVKAPAPPEAEADTG